MTSGCLSEMIFNNSDEGTIFLASHLLPVNGMNSMKRTQMGLSLVMAKKSKTSESFSPLTTTTFNFKYGREARATSNDRSTKERPLRRVMNSNLNSSNVSKLKFR